MQLFFIHILLQAGSSSLKSKLLHSKHTHSVKQFIRFYISIVYFKLFWVLFRWQKYLNEVKATYWVLMSRENGHLEIYSLPDLQLSYLVAGAGLGHRVMYDSLGAIPTVAMPSQSSLEGMFCRFLSESVHFFTKYMFKNPNGTVISMLVS